MRREPWLVAALLLAPSAAHAQGALGKESLLEYIEGRTDLDQKERKAYERQIRVRFGGAALEPQDEGHVEIMVAKEILSAAIFLQIPAKQAVGGAWDGYHGALDYVPPPIAVDYELLKFQGRPPKGRPIDLAFDFPRFYSDEIAPDLVAYWEDALANGKVREWDLEETQAALSETRKLMRPLLLEKLRLLARLAKERAHATGRREKFLGNAIAEVEAELSRSFKGVAAKPEVLDRNRPAFQRLKAELDATRKQLSPEDRLLDPALWSDSADRVRKERDETSKREEARRQREAEERRKLEAAEQRERAKKSERERAKESERERATESELVTERESERERTRESEREREREREKARESERERATESERERAAESEREASERPRETWTFERIRIRLEGVVGSWLGTPYLWGGSAKRVGTDCSGFTRGVMSEAFSIRLPRTSRDQFFEGQEVEAAPEPGDLVFFDIKDSGQISHVGISLGNGKFAHAGSSTGVTRADLSARYFQRAYRGARRVIGED